MLINVRNECLVQKAKGYDYMALSYVWGSLPTLRSSNDRGRETPILRTLTENVHHLSSPGSLSESTLALQRTGRIPQTVRDAMIMTRQAGIKYL